MKHLRRPSKTSIAISIALLGLAAIIFLKLADDIWFQEGFWWDTPMMLAIHRFSSPPLDALVMVFTSTGGKLLPLVFLGAGIVLWRKKRKTELIALGVSTGGSFAINGVLKWLFARPRPAVFPPLTVETTFSFPSGHTMAAVAFYGLLAVFLWQWHQRGSAMFSAGWVFIIAFSRIYLGVHYPSDVLGALAVGLLWLIIVVWAHRGLRAQQYAPLQLFHE